MALLHLASLMATLLLATAPAPATALGSASNASTADLSALLAFKARLPDPHGVLRASWTAGTPYCGWVGVSCGSRHRLRVTALVLPGVPLVGTLAPELGNLSFLSSLNLSNAELTGPIPADLGKLRRLLSLDLSSNYLSGAVPPALGNLTALLILNLDSNNLTGEIPYELRNLQNVGFLSLSRNDLSGPVPQNLFNGTSQLRFLSLALNSLTGNIPSAIGFLPNLEVLELSRNQLSGQIPSSLFNMSNLQWLYLSKNNLSGPVPNNQSFNLPMLQRAYLNKNNLTGMVPPGFGLCKNLQQFNLAYNHFTGGIPLWLSAMPELTIISLGGNDLSGEIPSSLSNLTGLTVLDFTTSKLHGKIPAELGRLTQLQWLNLEMNNLSGTIPSSIKNMSTISILDISFNSLTGPVPRKIFGESLSELYIDENKLSGDVGFLADLSSCKSLKYIVMSTNYFTGSIPNSFSNLSSLQIFRAFENQITGNIPKTLTNQSSILFINLRNNRLTGEIPISVTELKNLQALELSSNELSGTIPAHIGRLANLYGLNLSKNKLHGTIPDSIGNLSQLQILGLSANRLTSTIPMGLWGLQNIVKLGLSLNALSGSLSENVENLKAITLMDLSSNQLHGNLPASLGVLSTLTNLNLSKNMFQDQVPDAIGKLSSINTLDLSYNSLSGTIPKYFANLSYLTSLNLSFNRLSGQIPVSGVFSNITLQSLVGNTALCGLPRLGFPHCPNDELNLHHRSGFLKYVLPSAIATGIIGVCLFTMVRIRVKKRSKEVPVTRLAADNYRPLSYFELVRATNNFDDDNLIGAGSYGKVFKGKLDDEQIIAVKVLNMELERATMSFDVECRALRLARHRNLLRILTTCSNLDFKALVLQYMPNGSLDEWLFSSNRRGLGLVQRVSIMLDVALAMAYLHHEHFEVVLHCDLKPSNVLLDEDMTARVADFGIARLLLGNDTSIVSRNMHGTIGYMAPEYASTGKASRKSDVFSYGIMLLEVITGKKPTDTMFNEELSLREWVNQAFSSRLADVVDHNIFLDEEATSSGDIQEDNWSSREESPNGWSCLAQMLDLGLQCSHDLPEERMTMKDVAAKLERIKKCLSSSR
ncbi:receptor kinase-like protein Xa21 [Phragmites australis]|uniref:receptor kinase-like protein Xa21 n=1 Tax=Phragmites australis TaxID=29695 RepID=UPI002D76D618|nr:receptor kinase-like protein Xa21 [Phragmites australis]